MAQSAKKTVRLDPQIHRVLRRRAAKTGKTISEVVSRAVMESLREDELDLEAFEQRKHEPPRPLSDVVRDLKRDGLLDKGI